MTNITASSAKTQLLKSHPTTTVGDHDFLELTVKEWIDIEPIPTNRLSENRVPKMREIFDAAHNGHLSTLTEVALGIVVNDFEDRDPDTNILLRKYTKGDWYRVDGNTRAHYWKTYPTKAEDVNKLTAKVHYLHNTEDVKMAYYPYNSQKSVEKASEILQGLARRYNWQARQPVFAKGGYKSAIDWASTVDGTTPDIFEAFNTCFEGLKFLDSIPKGTGNTITSPEHPKLKSQAIIAALLVAHKIWGNNLNLYSLVDRLANIEQNEVLSAISTTGELDPVQIIAAEYMEISNLRGKGNHELWLKGFARSTKFESQAPQMDFLLYWIEKYIKNPKITYKAVGVKTEVTIGTWADLVTPPADEE